MTYREAKKIKPRDVVLTDKHYIRLHVLEIQHDESSHDIFLRCDDGRLYHHTALYMPMPVDEIVRRFVKDPSTRVYIDYNNELGANTWLYSVVVDESEWFWLDSFDTEEEAKKYIAENHLKMVGE